MKLLSGSVLLVGAEQAFAHAQLVQFPNQSTATSVLIPASVVMLTMGTLLVIWGLFSDARSVRNSTTDRNTDSRSPS
jgi:hypothetical protein